MNDKLNQVATSKLITHWGSFVVTTYETHYPDQPRMQYALAIATKHVPEIPLVRVQSACLFGETFLTTQCDCGEQLAASMQMIHEQGGILFYLDHEGRGHGILDKSKELQLQQEKGLDTVEASEYLNLNVDARKYDVVADILKSLHQTRIKLITNNPSKLNQLTDLGIQIIERIPIEIKPNPDNEKYLAAKKAKLGHLLTKYV